LPFLSGKNRTWNRGSQARLPFAQSIQPDKGKEVNSRPSYTLTLTLLFFSATVAGEDFRGRVVRISDGDTIGVMHQGREEKIRLHGIDAPERKQPFGIRAKLYSAGLAFEKDVTVKPRGTDRYGRTIADVILPDGRNLNREMLKAGFAWWFRRYAPYDEELKRLEAEAREAKRGLWADPEPVPPWERRAMLRQQEPRAAIGATAP
jgi:micrococcal nuclease